MNPKNVINVFIFIILLSCNSFSETGNGFVLNIENDSLYAEIRHDQKGEGKVTLLNSIIHKLDMDANRIIDFVHSIRIDKPNEYSDIAIQNEAFRAYMLFNFWNKINATFPDDCIELEVEEPLPFLTKYKFDLSSFYLNTTDFSPSNIEKIEMYDGGLHTKSQIKDKYHWRREGAETFYKKTMKKVCKYNSHFNFFWQSDSTDHNTYITKINRELQYKAPNEVRLIFNGIHRSEESLLSVTKVSLELHSVLQTQPSLDFEFYHEKSNDYAINGEVYGCLFAGHCLANKHPEHYTIIFSFPSIGATDHISISKLEADLLEGYFADLDDKYFESVCSSLEITGDYIIDFFLSSEAPKSQKSLYNDGKKRLQDRETIIFADRLFNVSTVHFTPNLLKLDCDSKTGK